jgi:hypothetical protein
MGVLKQNLMIFKARLMVMLNCTNKKKEIMIPLHIGYFVASHGNYVSK